MKVQKKQLKERRGQTSPIHLSFPVFLMLTSFVGFVAPLSSMS